MMPFTLNILRLMRDYNGSHSERAVPSGAHLSAPIQTSEGLSYETDTIFLTEGTRV